MPSASKPGLIVIDLVMFRTKSTPIVKSTTDTASCITISPPRRLQRPSTWRSVRFRAALTPPRVALSAGSRPATRALAMAITAGIQEEAPVRLDQQVHGYRQRQLHAVEDARPATG